MASIEQFKVVMSTFGGEKLPLKARLKVRLGQQAAMLYDIYDAVKVKQEGSHRHILVDARIYTPSARRDEVIAALNSMGVTPEHRYEQPGSAGNIWTQFSLTNEEEFRQYAAVRRLLDGELVDGWKPDISEVAAANITY